MLYLKPEMQLVQLLLQDVPWHYAYTLLIIALIRWVACNNGSWVNYRSLSGTTQIDAIIAARKDQILLLKYTRLPINKKIAEEEEEC